MRSGELVMLSWYDSEARIRKCATATSTKATVVRVEIEVTDPSCLANLMRDIQEAMRPLALPSPQTRLTDRSE